MSVVGGGGAAAPYLCVWAAAAGLDPPTLKRRLSDGSAAKRRLVTANIPLVYSIVDKHYGRRVANLQLSIGDLVQEGIVGLVHAAELYDPARANGARFGTYAWYRVRARIDAAILADGRTVKVPRRLMQTYRTAVATLTAELQRAPTDADLARHLNMPPSEVVGRFFFARHRVASLNHRMAAVGDTAYDPSDDSIDTGAGGEERSAIGDDLRRLLAQALAPRESRLISLRYGLDDGRSRTIRECAREAGIGVATASRSLDDSIDRIRTHLTLHGYAPPHSMRDGVTDEERTNDGGRAARSRTASCTQSQNNAYPRGSA